VTDREKMEKVARIKSILETAILHLFSAQNAMEAMQLGIALTVAIYLVIAFVVDLSRGPN
jgi:hypothetical protein